MNPGGLVVVALGVLLLLFPRRIARSRLRGAEDPTPTPGAVRQVRWVGGGLLVGVGLLIVLS
jgi:hypothetical protein